MQKKTLVAVAAVVIVGGLAFTTQTFAQKSNSPMTSLVDAIAQKFNLNQADVQAVFDQHKQDREAQMESQFEAKLSQDVTDGKITDSQRQLIIAKHKELESDRQNNMQYFKSMTPEQRKQAMQQEKTDLENWAKQNNIDLKYLMPIWGMRGKMGFGRRMM